MHHYLWLMYIFYIHFPKTPNISRPLKYRSAIRKIGPGHSVLSKPIFFERNKCISMRSFICIFFEIYEFKMAFSVYWNIWNQDGLLRYKLMLFTWYEIAEPFVLVFIWTTRSWSLFLKWWDFGNKQCHDKCQRVLSHQLVFFINISF